jgi:hypothetical protein
VVVLWIEGHPKFDACHPKNHEKGFQIWWEPELDTDYLYRDPEMTQQASGFGECYGPGCRP